MNQQNKEFERFGATLNELVNLVDIAGLPRGFFPLENFVQFVRICKQNFLTKYRANRFNDWSFGKFVWGEFEKSLLVESHYNQTKRVFIEFCVHMYCGNLAQHERSIGDLNIETVESQESKEIIVFTFGSWSKHITIYAFYNYFDTELKPALVKNIKQLTNKNKKLESAALWRLIKSTNPEIIGMSFEEIDRYFQIKTRIKK